MTEPYVKIDIQNEVGYIEFFHPAHNSLPGNLLAELAQTITDTGINNDIKVIVLKSGKDRTFCAGASFKELINIGNIPMTLFQWEINNDWTVLEEIVPGLN